MDGNDEPPSMPGVPLDPLPPEIQSQIGSYLGVHSLFNAILVNKEWFSRLIDLLWHTAPINSVKLNSRNIRTRSRRQYYAAKICQGFMSCPSALDDLLEDLDFASIKHLSIHNPDPRLTSYLG